VSMYRRKSHGVHIQVAATMPVRAQSDHSKEEAWLDSAAMHKPLAASGHWTLLRTDGGPASQGEVLQHKEWSQAAPRA
jgi:hypothetical protein